MENRQGTRTASLRPIVEAVAAEAEADRQHHRTRKRSRGDCGLGFFDDGDRFALAAMVAMRMAHKNAPIMFGGKRSVWSSAKHAAALFAPGRGRRVNFQYRRVEGALIVRASFEVGNERHETSARRLIRKDRELAGLAATWVAISGALLARLNGPTSSASRTYVRALLDRLGWDRMPNLVWARAGQMLAPNDVNELIDLFAGARP